MSTLIVGFPVQSFPKGGKSKGKPKIARVSQSMEPGRSWLTVEVPGGGHSDAMEDITQITVRPMGDLLTSCR
jgi:hypothetical protein